MTQRRARAADPDLNLPDAARELKEFIGEQMDQRPYAALGAAAAVGYALARPRGAVALLASLYSRMALGWFETLFEEAPSKRATRQRRTR